MASNFQFPLSYIDSMMPNAATAHETVTAAMPQELGSTEESDTSAALRNLLATLETARPPQPHQLKTWQRVLGGLGDAIQAMAAVRAGGAPPTLGPFAARQLAQEKQFQEQSMAADEYNRETRNKVRIGAFEEGLRARREKEVAGVRNIAKQRPFQLKQFSDTDAQGKPIKVPYNYDPNSGTLAPAPGYEQGFDQYIRPFLAQGVNPDTGQPEFKLVDPFGREGGKPVSGIAPAPNQGAAKEAATSLNMRVLYKDALSSFESYLTKSSSGQRKITSAGRRIPVIGGLVEENILSYRDPEGVDVARKIDNLADILLRLRSGAQINPQEYDRLRSLLPKLGENPKTALANFKRFETELLTFLRINYQRAPSLFTPGVLSDLGLSQTDLQGPANSRKSASDRLDDLLNNPPGE